MSMTEKISKALDKQINEEMASAYLYLAMSEELEARNLPGMAHWLRLQWEEELVHALKLFDFAIRRGARVSLQSLEAPEVPDGSNLELFKNVLKHEQHITASIHNLYELAKEERDHALSTMLEWFIDEQVEEEDNARQVIDKLTLAGDSGTGLLLVDQELAKRVAEPDASEGA